MTGPECWGFSRGIGHSTVNQPGYGQIPAQKRGGAGPRTLCEVGSGGGQADATVGQAAWEIPRQTSGAAPGRKAWVCGLAQERN